MKRKILLVFSILASLVFVGFVDPYARRIRPVPSLGSCSENEIAYNTTSHSLAICTNTGYKNLLTTASGAPIDATYITQTANSSLSNEQALSTLSTGIMRVATTTGVITSLTDSAGIFANISDETGGTGVLVGSISPNLVTPNIGVATATSLSTATNCADSAGAAACGSAAAGSFVIDAGTSSTVVSTTAVTANSQIIVQEDSSLGTRLSVTCNTQSSLTLGAIRVTARTASTSFTVTLEANPTTNPMCVNYWIIN